jgi:Uma2 family endonuclease
MFSYSSPSFDHQQIVMRVARQLYDWARSHNAGAVVHGPIDMVLSPHLVMQPDAVFIARHRLGIIERAIRGPADLVVEVMSLGHRNRDRIEKRDLYEQHGVEEYWIVDPEARTVEVLHLENAR